MKTLHPQPFPAVAGISPARIDIDAEACSHAGRILIVTPRSLSEKDSVARGGSRPAGKERGPHDDGGVVERHRGDVGGSDAASGDGSRPAAGGFLRQTPRIVRAIAAITAVSSLLILMAAFLVPLLMHLGYGGAGLVLWKALGPLCHQKHERSLYILGWQMGLCARCTALFLLTLAAGLMISLRPRLLLRRRPMYALSAAAMLPMLAEVGIALALDTDYPVYMRMITGAMYGGGSTVFTLMLVHDAGCWLEKHIGKGKNGKRGGPHESQ
jgi:uncharacterized membrane protein